MLPMTMILSSLDLDDIGRCACISKMWALCVASKPVADWVSTREEDVFRTHLP